MLCVLGNYLADDCQLPLNGIVKTSGVDLHHMFSLDTDRPAGAREKFLWFRQIQEGVIR